MKIATRGYRTSVAVVALAASLGLMAYAGWSPLAVHTAGAAWAAEDGHSDGGSGTDQHEGKGKGGQAGHGSDGGHAGQGGQGGQGKAGSTGAGGHGQGGPGDESDGKGPHAGAPAGSRGTRPVWAKEGIPEVELGRLNVVRSPDHVLQRAYDEALASLTPEMVSFYNLPLDQAIEQLALNWDNIAFFDSPLQNLALLKDALDGSSALSGLGVTNDTGTLKALFLGTASDKTMPISSATVTAVTTILGDPVTGAAADDLAARAEAVRIAVLAGHDG